MLDLERAAPDSRDGAGHIVFSAGKLLMDLRSPTPPVLSDGDLRSNGWTVEREQFVGYWQGLPYYAVDVGGTVELDPMRYQAGTLYHLIGRVEDPLFALTGRASQLLDWERDHSFCGRCGAPMQIADGERAMHCKRCDTLLYPRIAPCVITLVTRGEEMLLARSARFPRPMYSTLAGFIEAGESAEETLRREVREEVGVEVGELRYFASQAWPFPNQLMLGFFADFESGEIRPDPAEIADAGWFSARELPTIPPPQSIAGQLIQTHCERIGATPQSVSR